MGDRRRVAGFVDLQVNGVRGVDVATADGDDWERIDEALAASGVTSWCPTLTTRADYEAPLERIARAMERSGPRPRIAGVHLEGPYLGTRHGAHAGELVKQVDLDWLRELPSAVRIVTLGPEQPDAVAAAKLLTSRGVVVALGHSGATAERVNEVEAAGATLVTHVFNAMAPLHHRDPGLVGAALTNDHLATSVIADGRHLSAEALQIVFRCKPADKVIVVSDQVAGEPVLGDGTLAGGNASMIEAVTHLVRSGIDVEAALRAASTNPARLLGVDEPDDRIVLDDQLRVVATYVAGECIYER